MPLIRNTLERRKGKCENTVVLLPVCQEKVN